MSDPSPQYTSTRVSQSLTNTQSSSRTPNPHSLFPPKHNPLSYLILRASESEVLRGAFRVVPHVDEEADDGDDGAADGFVLAVAEHDVADDGLEQEEDFGLVGHLIQLCCWVWWGDDGSHTEFYMGEQIKTICYVSQTPKLPKLSKPKHNTFKPTHPVIIKMNYEPEVHNRLSVLQYKDVRLPRLEEQGLSTTKVLELIKRKRMELGGGGGWEGGTIGDGKVGNEEVGNEKVEEEEGGGGGKEKIAERKEGEGIVVENGKVEDVRSMYNHGRSRKSVQSVDRNTGNTRKDTPESPQQPNPNPTTPPITPTRSLATRLKTTPTLSVPNLPTIPPSPISSLPTLSQHRTPHSLRPIVSSLSTSSPFFAQLSPLLTASLLKVACLRTFPSGRSIYHKSDRPNSLFIILSGIVRLTDVVAGWKKICSAGETIGQGVIFTQKTRGQNATSVQDCQVLQIPVDMYRRVSEELILYGYKTEVLAMQEVIRGNYVEKVRQHRMMQQQG